MQSVDHSPPKLTRGQILVILSGLLIGLFLASIGQTLVFAAMKKIADQLGGQSDQAWATTAFLVTTTVSTPLWGKLGDIFGRKWLFIIAMVIFVVGSLLAGFSTSIWDLATYRGVQGLGAGGISALAFAIIGDIISPRERGSYQAYFVVVFGIASVSGPFLGGLFANADTILGVDGWRWLFFLNVPIGLIGVIVVLRFLKLPRRHQRQRIDVLGAALLMLGVTAVLIIAQEGQDWGWLSTPSIVCYSVAAVTLLGFLLVEKIMGDAAILPLQIFRNPGFGVASVLNILIGFSMFGALAVIPLYLQLVNGLSPAATGSALLPTMLAMVGSSLVAGILTTRFGRYKLYPIIGASSLVIGYLGMRFFAADATFLQLIPFLVLFGIGIGASVQTLILATQNFVPSRQLGVATASAIFFRTLGSTLGTSIFLSLFFAQASTATHSQIAAASDNPAFAEALKTACGTAIATTVRSIQNGGTFDLNNTEFLTNANPLLTAPFHASFVEAGNVVFLFGAGMAVLALTLAAVLREIPLRTEAGAVDETETAPA